MAPNGDKNDPSSQEQIRSQREDREGQSASKRQKVNAVRTRVTTLYTRAPDPRWILDSAATSHICWDRDCFTSLRQHRETLDTAGDPVEAEGMGTVKLSLRGKPQRSLILKNVYYAPRIGMNLISVPKLLRDRYSVVAHPHETLLQRSGKNVGKAKLTEDDLMMLHCQASKKTSVRVNMARNSTNSVTTLERRADEMDVDDPESSGQQKPVATTGGQLRPVATSELNSEQMALEADAVGKEMPEEIWHARLGHLNRSDLRILLRQTSTPHQLMSSSELLATPQCPACMSGKQHRKRFSRRKVPTVHSTRIFEYVHSDVAEMPTARDGSRYAITFTDDYSRGTWAYAMKRKAEALAKYKLFEAWVERQFEVRIKRFLSDNGGEYGPIRDHLEAQGIEYNTSAPYCKGQNGLAERTNRTLKEKMNAILMDAKLPQQFWTEILDTVTYLKFRSPASILNKRTPFEVLYGKKPHLEHLRRIGSKAWVLIPEEHRGKIDQRSSECLLLGYSEPFQYKLYELHSGRILHSRDVEFDERAPVVPIIEPGTTNDISAEKTPSVESMSSLPREPPRELPNAQLPSTNDAANSNLINPVAAEATEIPNLGYSLYGRLRLPSRRLLEAQGKVFFISPPPSGTPRTFQEATAGSGAIEWWASIQREYDSLIDNGTWEKIQRKDVPQGHKIIGCKWVFKTKTNGLKKSRLVILGYRQTKGIDYAETFAAVSRMDSTRSIVASSVLKGWKLSQFDATTAFLHGDIDAEIYMELPEGFREEGHVCRLRRSLYGLKQAPRIWYRSVKRVLLSHGFTMAYSDPCVFHRKNCVICVYVDDFLVAASNDSEVNAVKQALDSEFKMNDLGTPRSFLGIEFEFHPEGSVSIHQRQYVRKILTDFCMESSQPKQTPMNAKISLNQSDSETDLDEDDKSRYGSAIGALMYLMIGTRPDIAFALSILSRFVSCPQSHHQAAIQRLLRYLRATESLKITYRRGDLIGYTDADFGGSVVTEGAYSTSGYVFKLAGAPISWSSKKQGEIATSTTHAEYIGQYNAILHLQWLRTFLQETDLFTTPVTNIMADNQSAIALSRNPEFHKRTKHFNVKLHYQRDVLEEGSIDVQYIPTKQQAADGLTKPLGPAEFLKFIQLIGMESHRESNGND